MELLSSSAPAPKTTDEAVAEVMRLHSSLPPRPAIEEVEAAAAVIRNVEKEEHLALEAINKEIAKKGGSSSRRVPDELFAVIQDMRRAVVGYRSKEQKREAVKVLDLERLHSVFGDSVQRASRCVSSSSSSPPKSLLASSTVIDSSASGCSNSVSVVGSSSAVTTATVAAVEKNGGCGGTVLERPSSSSKPTSPPSGKGIRSKDDIFYRSKKPTKATLYVDVTGISRRVSPSPTTLPMHNPSSSSPPQPSFSSQTDGKLSLIKLAGLIELTAKKGGGSTGEFNLSNKLSDSIDWLPDSIGKLTALTTLDISDNRITTIPTTIKNLSSLTKLNLSSNRITHLPDSLSTLSTTLTHLDLHGNNLTTLPPFLSKLTRLQTLNVSSNHLLTLPDSLFPSLTSLHTLNLETNDVDELPHTISHCTALRELRADYNRLKALPEAIGKTGGLEVLSVRYNNVRTLPSTVSSMVKLRELDVSFNELECVTENLCLATSLMRLNLGGNFADLKGLPRNIGNLEMLEELDISNNQIRVLPESFRFLTRLCRLRVDENPLEVPPRRVAEKGAKAVVQYMDHLYADKDVGIQPLKHKRSWDTLRVWV